MYRVYKITKCIAYGDQWNLKREGASREPVEEYFGKFADAEPDAAILMLDSHNPNLILLERNCPLSPIRHTG